MAQITISDMHFYAYHGCFEEEQSIGTHFSVDVVLDVDTSMAQRTDSIADTVNYLEVYRVVKGEMEIPSHLLEHVADRVGHAVLDRFPLVQSLQVRVSKLNPPLGGQINSVCVSIDVSR